MHFSFGSLQLELGVKKYKQHELHRSASFWREVGVIEVGCLWARSGWAVSPISSLADSERQFCSRVRSTRLLRRALRKNRKRALAFFWLSLLLESTATVLQKGHLFEDLEERFLRYRTFKYFQCVGSCSLNKKIRRQTCFVRIFKRPEAYFFQACYFHEVWHFRRASFLL